MHQYETSFEYKPSFYSYDSIPYAKHKHKSLQNLDLKILVP